MNSFLVYAYSKKPEKDFQIKKNIVFYRCSVLKINGVTCFKFSLLQKIFINYISFKCPYQNKVNGAVINFLCCIGAEIWVFEHFYA